MHKNKKSLVKILGSVIILSLVSACTPTGGQSWDSGASNSTGTAPAAVAVLGPSGPIGP